MDTERLRRVMERVYGSAEAAAERRPPDALRECIRMEADAAALLRSVMHISAACRSALGGALRRCEARRKTLRTDFFLREGERPPLRRQNAPPGVLSALRQIVLLCRARASIYERPENALPLSPDTARRFAAECRSEESAAARLLALSMK